MDRKIGSTLLVFSGILLFTYMAKPLIPGFCLALVLVYLLNPVTNFFQKYTKKRGIATLISFFIVVGSFGGLSYFLVGETVEEAEQLLKHPYMKEIGIDFLDSEDFYDSLLQLLGDTGARLLKRIGVEVGMWVIQIFIGLLLSFFVVWKNMGIPVKDEKARKLLHIIDRGIKHLVLSFFLTAVVTGFISIPIYYGFGLPYPLFLAVMTAFLTLLPVIGAYLLYMPLTVILYFERGLSESLLFLGICVVFISILPDILVRPLTARTREVGAIPLLVGFVSGILVFGVSGIVLGPLIVITGIAFWRVYIREDRREN
ncbi:MAG: hypothetical protein AYK19_12805 [Theionarchaea archaeon DG-70-1]|nr:MAG: hypothetical protein AYK19_12805 [Theionarchaea archaeon DG-70-1]